MKSFVAFATLSLVLLGLAWSWNALESTSEQEALDEGGREISEVHWGGMSRLEEPVVPVPGRVKVEANGEKGALNYEVSLSHRAVQEAGVDELYGEIRIQAEETLPERRPALNVALVIDRSGSMRGEPMAYARDAARAFVNALHPGDRIALVSFDHAIRIEVPSRIIDERSRAELLARIDAIREGGATNISGGLRDGFQEVRRNRSSETVDRVILMTDGVPNVGITSTAGLAQKVRGIRGEGITVSALGFGADYQAEMMAELAREGAGTFRHIRNAADLEIAFTEELRDLHSTVASGIEVDLIPAAGVQILEVYGFGREEIAGGERVVLGDINAGGRRSVMVRLAIDPSDRVSRQPVLEVETRFFDRVRESEYRSRSALAVERTAREAVIAAGIDRAVIARAEEIRADRSIREVMDLYARGDARAATERLDRLEQDYERSRQVYDLPEEAEETRRVRSRMESVGSGIRSLAPGSAAGRNFRQAQEEVSSVSLQGR